LVPEATAVTAVGAPGVFGTVADAKVAAAESPRELFALIENVYSAPALKPVITFVVSLLVAVVETPEAVIL
jgi:hypothetical protein